MLHVWDQDGFGYFCKRCATRSRLGPGGAVAEELCPAAMAGRPYVGSAAEPGEGGGEGALFAHLLAMGRDRPDLMQRWLDLLHTLLHGPSDLDHTSRAAVATVAAQAAGSHYMAEAMRTLLDRETAVALSHGWKSAQLDPARQALLAFAERLTRRPGALTREEVDRLRGHGFSDEAMMTTAHLVGCICHGIRLADGLGAPLEPYMSTPRPE